MPVIYEMGKNARDRMIGVTRPIVARDRMTMIGNSNHHNGKVEEKSDRDEV